jgi:acetyl-CoA carboxylase beta subunit
MSSTRANPVTGGISISSAACCAAAVSLPTENWAGVAD